LEGADPLTMGAGNMAGAQKTSASTSSRGLRQCRVRQRHWSNQASIGNIPKVPGETSRIERIVIRKWLTNGEMEDSQKTPMRGMGTGITAMV